MKLRPCPRCKNTKIETGDCGYNTFNPGWAKCTKCGYEVKVGDCDNQNDPCIITAWNLVPVEEKLSIERAKCRKLRAQLKEAGIPPAA